VTRYLEHALAGDATSADEWNEHLIAFHLTYPDVTAKIVGAFHTADGETSYQRLARHAREHSPSARRVVDIGCGSGELLHHLNLTYDRAIELTGIDLSASELAFARRRVPGATLICGDVAQTLPVEQVDVVVAHLSFLSMARLRDAFRRIHDVLVPGGLLAFIVEDLSASESVVTIVAPLMRVLHERYPELDLAVPGREGAENELTMRELLKTTGFTGAVEVEPIVLSAHLSDDQIAEFALRSYPFGLLDESAQTALRERLLSNRSHSKDERTLVKLPLKLVTARRANGISTDRPPARMEYTQ